MEEWKEYKLAEVCENIYSGGTPSSMNASYWNGNLPWLSSGETSQRYIYYTEKCITKEGADNSSTRYAFKGSTVIASAGQGHTRGQASMLCIDTYVNQSVLVIKPNPLIINPYFLYFNIDSRYNELRQLSDGTSTRGSLSGKILKDLKIYLPPLNEQQKIVSILKSLDDKIEVNRKINENLEQQAQALFKSWLKKCEDEVTIGDLSLNITDYTKCEQKQVVLINSSDVTEGRFEHHNLSENKNLKGHFKKRFQKGDILYSQVRPRNRHWGYCTFNADNYLASTQLMVIRNRPDVISSILLYQYIIENKVWMDFTLRTETRSGTFPQGNYEDLSAIKVPFGADVKEITDNLENIYSLIHKNEDESRRLAELRDTLLPKLMSGELKVNEIER
jgi:type I restriction enzyme S subunit